MAVNVNVGNRSIFDDLQSMRDFFQRRREDKALGSITADQLPAGYEQFAPFVLGNPNMLRGLTETATGQIGPNQRNTAYLGAMQSEGEANRTAAATEGDKNRQANAEQSSLTRAFQETLARLGDATQRYGIDQNYDLGLRGLNVQDRNAGLERMSRERMNTENNQTQRYGVDVGANTAANSLSESARQFDVLGRERGQQGEALDRMLGLFGGPATGAPFDPNLGQIAFSTFVDPSSVGPNGLTSPYGAQQDRQRQIEEQQRMDEVLNNLINVDGSRPTSNLNPLPTSGAATRPTPRPPEDPSVTKTPGLLDNYEQGVYPNVAAKAFNWGDMYNTGNDPRNSFQRLFDFFTGSQMQEIPNPGNIPGLTSPLQVDLERGRAVGAFDFPQLLEQYNAGLPSHLQPRSSDQAVSRVPFNVTQSDQGYTLTPDVAAGLLEYLRSLGIQIDPILIPNAQTQVPRGQ